MHLHLHLWSSILNHFLTSSWCHLIVVIELYQSDVLTLNLRIVCITKARVWRYQCQGPQCLWRVVSKFPPGCHRPHCTLRILCVGLHRGNISSISSVLDLPELLECNVLNIYSFLPFYQFMIVRNKHIQLKVHHWISGICLKSFTYDILFSRTFSGQCTLCW